MHLSSCVFLAYKTDMGLPKQPYPKKQPDKQYRASSPRNEYTPDKKFWCRLIYYADTHTMAT